MSQKQRNQHGGSRAARTIPFVRPVIAQGDVEKLPDIMKEKCGWDIKDFQIHALRALADGTDVLVHAGTGYGKTAIFAGLHLLPAAKGMMSIVTSPLISLQNEQVRTFETEFGLSAVAVNSSHGGCSEHVLSEIVKGRYQVVLISPEMLQSRRFIRKILQRPDVTNRILLFGVDEAHCVSIWGDSFRKKYASLGNIRSFLPKATPVLAVSATLPPRVKRDVVLKLHINKNHIFLDLGNDRPNISIVVRPMVYAMNTFRDLSFLIPPKYTCPQDIPKTVIFCDNINEGHQMIDFLSTLLLPSHRLLGLIRPFNTTHSHAYRDNVMDAFRNGTVLMLVCTDLFGMGCNLPDIRFSIQWKRSSSVSNFVQRAGRAARGPGTKGIAVLLVEPSAYQAKRASAPKAGSTKRTRKPKAPAKQVSATGSALSDPFEEFPDTFDALIAKSPGAKCRRYTILGIYGHQDKARPTVPCCDVCSPSLIEWVKPRSYTKKRKYKNQGAARGVVQAVVRIGLLKWRDEVFALHHPYAIYSSAVILPEPLLDFLASIGPVESIESLKASMEGEGWYWWEKHGAHLFEFLSTKIVIPPFEPLPPKLKRGAGNLKRPLSLLAEQVFSGGPSPSPASTQALNGPSSTAQPPAKRPRPNDTEISVAPKTGSHPSASQHIQATPRPAPPVHPANVPPATPSARPQNPYKTFWPTPLPTPQRRYIPSAATPHPQSSFKDPNAANYLRAFQDFHSQQVTPASSRPPASSLTPHVTPQPRPAASSLTVATERNADR